MIETLKCAILSRKTYFLQKLSSPLAMEEIWKGRNIDQRVLGNSIVDFFERKGFKASMKKIGDNEYLIVAKPRTGKPPLANVKVIISGDPNNLAIKFLRGPHARQSTRTLVNYASFLLGFGYFALKNLKLQEELDRLEDEFWRFIESEINRLFPADKRADNQ